ncbi:Pycsar system effector family protein [Alloalcanivorax xenomutans]|uniref:Pycsar system effector family protein n=1 Tax=Alloalcanivorax xenomutans TaxID=1094342 RepID=UPI0024E1F118|nr:Pycsar system effector family protein [Alloalcanivorax xenomutans]
MDELRDTLESVNDWLKFAEAKNAVVVAASGFALWASLRLTLSPETECYVSTYFAILSAFLLAGFVTALLSFLPILNYRWIVPKPSKLDNGNLMYFGYLATLSKNQVLDAYIKATESREADTKEIHGMVAEQIIVNSRIAVAKFAMFEVAIKVLLAGVLTPVIAIPVLCISRKKRENIDGI